jgi:hypothetical protein
VKQSVTISKPMEVIVASQYANLADDDGPEDSPPPSDSEDDVPPPDSDHDDEMSLGTPPPEDSDDDLPTPRSSDLDEDFGKSIVLDCKFMSVIGSGYCTNMLHVLLPYRRSVTTIAKHR